MTRLILLTLAFLYLNCANSNTVADKNVDTGTIKADTVVEQQETRLGQSDYFILLPASFSITEARGKEGQLGYNIIPKDKTSTMSGLIEIRRGHPIGGVSIHDGPPKETISSYFLNKKVQWKIYVTETGYFDASTDEKSDLNATVSSKKRDEIDTLISIISTLKQK